MIKTVIFDFDGTMADTNELIINSFQHIHERYNGKKASIDYIVSTFGEPLITTIKRDFKENSEEVINTYREYQKDRFNYEVKLYPKTLETIQCLSDKGIKLGIVTSRLRKSLENALDNFQLTKYFEVVIAADDLKVHKPDPMPLLLAVKRLNGLPEETMFVGDSKFDMECAINANTVPVLVSWHEKSKELQEKYSIKYFINCLFDLIELI